MTTSDGANANGASPEEAAGGAGDGGGPGGLRGLELPQFAALQSGGPPVPPPTAPATPAGLARVAALVDGAALLGLEVELRYRVLAMTVELPAGRPLPGRGTPPADRRLQLLLHPVGRFQASLREADPDGVSGVVRVFDVSQLPDVTAILGGPELAGDLFDRPEPTDVEWGPVRSLDGRAQVEDGRTHRLRLDVAAVDRALALGFHATFDAVTLRDVEGREVVLPTD